MNSSFKHSTADKWFLEPATRRRRRSIIEVAQEGFPGISASSIYKELYQLCCLHSSEMRGLRSTKCSSKTHQNLLYFMYKKTHVVFFSFFILHNFTFPLMNALVYVNIDYRKFCWNISLSVKRVPSLFYKYKLHFMKSFQ